jgi:hypothetical protein
LGDISLKENKNMDKDIVLENILKNNYSQEYFRKVEHEMSYSIEYCKTEIVKYESNYYGF